MFRRALLRGKNILKHPSEGWRSIMMSVAAVPLYLLLLPITALLGHHWFMKYSIKLCDHGGKLLAIFGLNPIAERDMGIDRPPNTLGRYLQHIGFYIRKYGVVRCINIALNKFRIRAVGQREWLYSIDLDDTQFPEQADPEIELLPFQAQDHVGPMILEKLCKHKSRRACSIFLAKWFSRGATLWLSKVGDDIIGLQWTLQGGIRGFYSLPIHPREVIIVSVEVFQPFRGMGYYPRILLGLLAELKQSGSKRAYLKVATANSSMQRTMTKTPCKRISRVYTFKIFGRSVTIWG